MGRRTGGRMCLGRAGLRWSPAATETVGRLWTVPAAWRKRRDEEEGRTQCNTHGGDGGKMWWFWTWEDTEAAENGFQIDPTRHMHKDIV